MATDRPCGRRDDPGAGPAVRRARRALPVNHQHSAGAAPLSGGGLPGGAYAGPPPRARRGPHPLDSRDLPRLRGRSRGHPVFDYPAAVRRGPGTGKGPPRTLRAFQGHRRELVTGNHRANSSGVASSNRRSCRGWWGRSGGRRARHRRADDQRSIQRGDHCHRAGCSAVFALLHSQRPWKRGWRPLHDAPSSRARTHQKRRARGQ